MLDNNEGGQGNVGADLILRAVRKRWWQMAIIAIVLAGPAVVVVLSWNKLGLPSSYVARARVLIEAPSFMHSAQEDQLPMVQYQQKFFSTRVEILRSSTTMGRALEGLRQNPSFIGRLPTQIDKFLQEYSVVISPRTPSRASSSIASIQATGPEPQMAADVANAVLDAFKKLDEETNRGALQKRRSDLLTKIAATSGQLRTRDAEIEQFKARHNLDELAMYADRYADIVHLRGQEQEAEIEYKIRLMQKEHVENIIKAGEQPDAGESELAKDSPEEAESEKPNEASPEGAEEDEGYPIVPQDLVIQVGKLEADLREERQRKAYLDINIRDMERKYTQEQLETYSPYNDAVKDRKETLAKIDSLMNDMADAKNKLEKIQNDLRILYGGDFTEGMEDGTSGSMKKKISLLNQTSMTLKQAEQRWKMFSEKRIKAEENYKSELKNLDELRQKTQLRNQLKELQERLKSQLEQIDIEASILGDSVTEIDRATGPSDPNWPRPKKFIAVSIIGSLFAGFAFAFWREWSDKTVKSADEARNYLQVPIMGSLPLIKNQLELANGRLLLSDDTAFASESEHFRHLRGRLLHAYCDGNGYGIKTMGVTSATAGEGKTTIAVNLAISMAQVAKKVLLIDGDLRRPQLLECFQMENEKGLAQVLADECPVEEVIKPTSAQLVDLLPAGRSPLHPAELLEVGAISEVLKSVSKTYDLVIVDSPPVIGPFDSLQIAQAVDGVLFVVQAGKVKNNLLTKARNSLNQMGATMLGTVVNCEKMSKDEQYYYHDYYTKES